MLQDIAAAEEEATRKGVTAAAAEKSAAKLRRDVEKATGELEALEQKEETALAAHQEAKSESFDLQEAMKVGVPSSLWLRFPVGVSSVIDEERPLC